ncbi:putative membrane protein [Geobacillus kaustophilus]|uniref:Putative membrane protein n=1 Tax=Geobacillus kaustophilus TaxID=1462 RepID=A0A0D8BS27_GEOKU|nr:putative membrane protein [Geobacillus kaustophilus]
MMFKLLYSLVIAFLLYVLIERKGKPREKILFYTCIFILLFLLSR